MADAHVRIFDTTLRDGQQCPGAGMSFENNIAYARLAASLKVDVLEAGFPSASVMDFEIVRAIAEEITMREDSPVIAALCQLRPEQVERTIESLSAAIPRERARVHTYVPVDPALMAASLGDKAGDRNAIIRNVCDLIKMAVDAGCEAQFSPEGYSRMGANFDFVTELIRAAVSAGAAVINCPDTIGGASIMEEDQYFVKHMSRHADIIRVEFPQHDVTWSVHCHNDFGLAVQNSINGVFDGPARQIEGCINGIGERAGNASIEQCIMLIAQFGRQHATGGSTSTAGSGGHNFYTRCDATRLQEISDFVHHHMLPRQPHWPVTGNNAACHSSGGHTNAILNNPTAYQPFDPRVIGKPVTFIFGPLSGGNHAKAIIEDAGYRCDDNEKAAIAQFVKDKFSQRRKGITDSELMNAYFEYRSPMTVDCVDYAKNDGRAHVILYGPSTEKRSSSITSKPAKIPRLQRSRLRSKITSGHTTSLHIPA
jgi:2-isopropylmalate synthase